MSRNSQHILNEYLVINCQLGDAQAMHQLLSLWYPKLLRYAERQLNDPQQAQDAVQNTLETVSKKIGQLKDPAAFAKWVYQLLTHKCVDLIRTKQRQDKLSAEYKQFQHVLEQEAIKDNQQDNDFYQLIANLPKDAYQLVHLHYLEGFNMQEMAELLSIPAGTVKSRLHQARQLMRHHLTDFAGKPQAT